VEYRQASCWWPMAATWSSTTPRPARPADLPAERLGRHPLLNILLNPSALAGFYEAKAGSGQEVALEPRRKDLPRVVLTGRDGLLQRIQWRDATGASQEIELQNPRTPPPFAAATFTFDPPAGTRWLSPR